MSFLVINALEDLDAKCEKLEGELREQTELQRLLVAAGDEKASGIVEALRLLLTIELHAKIEIFNDLTEWIEKAQMLRADGNESPLLLRLRQMETRFAPPSTSTSTSTTIGKKRELSSSDTDEKKNKIASKRRILSHLKDSMEILMKDIITVQEEVDELEH